VNANAEMRTMICVNCFQSDPNKSIVNYMHKTYLCIDCYREVIG
jgi:uncharacterized protein (DUF2132 family)